MNNYSVFFTALLFISLLTGCHFSNSDTTGCQRLDEVRYIKEFPQSFSLTNDESVGLEVIGMKDLCIYDSLLIITTGDKKGMWSFFSLSNYDLLGKFLSRGKGPSEFIQSPYVSHQFLFKEKDQLYAVIQDFQIGKIYKMNIDESLKTQNLQMSLITESIPSFLFNFVYIDSVTYYCVEVADKQCSQIRYMLRDGEKMIPETFEKLNRIKLERGENMNILSTSTKRNAEGDKIVEMPIGLNQINLYAIDGSFAKTICVGDRLDNIADVENTNRWSRKYTYGHLRTYPGFFAALYINEEEKIYQMGRVKLPVIQCFDWNGEPIAELKLNRQITSFDIDFVKGYLYTLDSLTDEFYKYDIGDILKKLPS